MCRINKCEEMLRAFDPSLPRQPTDSNPPLRRERSADDGIADSRDTDANRISDLAPPNLVCKFVCIVHAAIIHNMWRWSRPQMVVCVSFYEAQYLCQ